MGLLPMPLSVFCACCSPEACSRCHRLPLRMRQRWKAVLLSNTFVGLMLDCGIIETPVSHLSRSAGKWRHTLTPFNHLQTCWLWLKCQAWHSRVRQLETYLNGLYSLVEMERAYCARNCSLITSGLSPNSHCFMTQYPAMYVLSLNKNQAITEGQGCGVPMVCGKHLSKPTRPSDFQEENVEYIVYMVMGWVDV